MNRRRHELRLDAQGSDEVATCCFRFREVLWVQRVELVVIPTPGGDERQGLVCHRRCLVERIDRRVPLHPDLDTG
jgi:hypothetical protein